LLVDVNKPRPLIYGTVQKYGWVQIVALRNIYRGCHGVTNDVMDDEYVDGTLMVTINATDTPFVDFAKRIFSASTNSTSCKAN
jgi:hypothetical protein